MKKKQLSDLAESLALVCSIIFLLCGFSLSAAAEEPAAGIVTTGAVTEIYLDGVSGSDANDGLTVSTPVKTFAQARALADSYDSDIQTITIYILNTVSISGDISLSGINATVKRYPSFTGYLMQVSSSSTAALSNITIDGNSENVTGTVSSSLISSYGTLNIQDGTVLQNNAITAQGYFASRGGAVLASGGTVNMTGGTITGCSANMGGGIFVINAVMNFSGGVIRSNSAVDTYSGSSRHAAAGGGICVYDRNAVLNLSGTAQIINNTSEDMGGGISVGTGIASNQAQTLNMTGGTISGNTAGSAGGGIYIQSGFAEGAVGTANITGGTISYNTMSGTGIGNSDFGGGGIYVNGSSYIDSTTSERVVLHGILNLTNVLITDNTAALQGGGYAACPISETNVYVNDGAALFGNTAASAQEIYILATNAYELHYGDPTYTISTIMLGGTSYQWKYDDGTEVPYDEMTGTLDADIDESLSLHTDVTSDANAEALATVRIIGNTSATRGGGIGSNGVVNIGKLSTLIDVTVSKTWLNDDRTDRPDSITVELYRSTEGSDADPIYVGYQTMTPDSDGSWPSLTFSNLPAEDSSGNAYIYSVAERTVDGYTSVISGSQEEGFTITNVPQISIPVTKVWSGGTGSSVVIHLYADGEEVSSCQLSADNAWQYTFTDLDQVREDGTAITYTVTEDAVSGYTTSISGSQEEGFTITNTKTPPITRQPVPDTGDRPANP